MDRSNDSYYTINRGEQSGFYSGGPSGGSYQHSLGPGEMPSNCYGQQVASYSSTTTCIERSSYQSSERRGFNTGEPSGGSYQHSLVPREMPPITYGVPPPYSSNATGIERPNYQPNDQRGFYSGGPASRSYQQSLTPREMPPITYGVPPPYSPSAAGIGRPNYQPSGSESRYESQFMVTTTLIRSDRDDQPRRRAHRSRRCHQESSSESSDTSSEESETEESETDSESDSEDSDSYRSSYSSRSSSKNLSQRLNGVHITRRPARKCSKRANR